jgi:cell shape-determining protein MreC
MSYLQDRKKDLKRKKLTLIIGVFILILLLSIFGLFKGLGGFLHKIGGTLWKTEVATTNAIDNIGYVVRTKKSVFQENENLKNKNTELESKMLDYTLVQKENEDLKILLGRLPEKNDFILANIISKPNRSLYDTIVIDIGSDKNIVEGAVVFANAEFPIGKITKVYQATALVTLFSSSKEVTEAQIEGSNTSIELVGRGGSNFEINVPHDLDVPAGTFVVAPNHNFKIVAIVADIVSDPHDPMNKILLKSPVNIQELKWVQVLK